MNIIVFDTETTDKAKSFNAEPSTDDNWPRIVQMCWIEFNDVGICVEEHSYVIKPDNWTIQPGAQAVHGISMEYANEAGTPLSPVLYQFTKRITPETILVAHNLKFDYGVVASELLRYNIESNFTKAEQKCTMQIGTDVCKLAGRNGFKWPKLAELHQTLFGKPFDKAHDALADAQAAARCYWRLKAIGAI
jgi:DNA polymerase-3 subunit epsilon